MPKVIADDSAIRENAGGALADCSQGVFIAAIVALTLLGAALRYFGCRTELWLDELISLHSAQTLSKWRQVFTSIHMDNNHYLNTLYLYLVGEQSDSARYRYFSLFCGTLSIPAAAWALSNRSRNSGLLLATLTTFSFPLVYFSSEARGYAAATLACFVAFGAADRWLTAMDKRIRARWGALYSISILFGLLSHLTFLIIAVALFAWLIWNTQKGNGALRESALLHAMPLAAFLLTAYFDFRGYFTLGGSRASVAQILSRLLANSLGWPMHDSYSIWLIGIPLLAFLCFRFYRAKQNTTFLFSLLCGVFFLFVIFSSKFPFLSQRYFLVFVPFVYLAIALALDRSNRIILIALLGLFVAGNLNLYFHFLHEGRGHYAEALRFIASRSSQPELRISSDQDFRAGVELDFYQRTLPPPYTVKFLRHNSGETADWLIIHDDAFAPARPEVIRGTSGYATKEALFGTSELSGQAWTVYRLHPVEPPKGKAAP